MFNLCKKVYFLPIVVLSSLYTNKYLPLTHSSQLWGPLQDKQPARQD